MKLNYDELCWLENNIVEIPMWIAAWTFIIATIMTALLDNPNMMMTTILLSGGVLIVGVVVAMIIQAMITEKLDEMENKQN